MGCTPLTPKAAPMIHFLNDPAGKMRVPMRAPRASPSKSWWKTMAMNRGCHCDPPEVPSETPIMMLCESRVSDVPLEEALRLQLTSGR